MAVVVRCSCVIPRPKIDNCARRKSLSEHFSGDIHVSGKVASFPLKLFKFFSSFGNAAYMRFVIQPAVQGRKSMHLEVDDVNGSISEQICFLGSIQRDYPAVFKHFAADQETVFRRLPVTALLLTNTLILTTPLDALAEACEVNKSVLDMPLLLFVALIGAAVGGLLARQRRGELQRLNEQLRQINAALRRQAKIESYAPSLSYAPVGGRVPETEVIVDPRKQELISCLKNGKNFLRNQDLEKAFVEFKAALELAQNLKDPIKEKKAARGLGASLQRQRKYREAIAYHSMVLEISKREGEESGSTEAYGAIADCYTELGDLEQAGTYYDQYIARLEKD